MKNQRLLDWSRFVIISLLVLFIYLSGLNKVTFYIDESFWIGTSSVFEAYFLGDAKSPLWSESYTTKTNPPLPRYIIGLGRSIGGFSSYELNSPWDYREDEKSNIDKGRKPSDNLLWWSRIPMAILASISILISYLVLRKLGGVSAYIWVVLCLINSFFLIVLRRAMSESVLLISLILLLPISSKILRIIDDHDSSQIKMVYLQFFVFGIAVGLAESSKLNGLSALSAGVLLSLIIAYRLKQNRYMKIRMALISSIILIISSQITFILLNPYLWPDPFNRSGIMFKQRVFEMQLQIAGFPESRIIGITERINVVIDRIFQSFSSIQINGFMTFNILFCLIGLSIIIINSFRYLKYKQSNPISIIILLISSTSVFPALFTPLDWDRYYLLPVYFSTMYIAIGIGCSIIFGYHSCSNYYRTNSRK